MTEKRKCSNDEILVTDRALVHEKYDIKGLLDVGENVTLIERDTYLGIAYPGWIERNRVSEFFFLKFRGKQPLHILVLMYFSAFVYLRWLWLRDFISLPTKSARSLNKIQSESNTLVLCMWVPFFCSGMGYYYSILYKNSEITKVRLWSVSKIHLMRNVFNTLFETCFKTQMDMKDTIIAALLLSLQMHCFLSSLIKDMHSNKLHESGFLRRSVRALGMNGMLAAIFSLFFMARNSFLHHLLSISSEQASRYHNWCGYISVFALALHSLGYLSFWTMDQTIFSKLIYCDNCSLKKQMKTQQNLYGCLAFLTILIVTIGSLPFVRRNYFRIFVCTHSLLPIVFLFTCLHYHQTMVYFVPPISIYIFYRILSLWQRQKCDIISYYRISKHIISLKLRCARKDHAPGQYMYLRIPQINSNWHPFSIASCERETLQFYIRLHGNFTEKLAASLDSKETLNVQVDGPYGSRIPVHSHMVFMAGGTGMTPFLSFFHSLNQQNVNIVQTIDILWTLRDVNLFYANVSLLRSIQSCPKWNCTMQLHCTVKSSLSHYYPRSRPSGSEMKAYNAVRITKKVQFLMFVSMSLSTFAMILILPSPENPFLHRFFMCCSVLCSLIFFGSLPIIVSSMRKRFPTPFSLEEVTNLNECKKDLHMLSISSFRPCLRNYFSLTLSRLQREYGMQTDIHFFVCGPSEFDMEARRAWKAQRSPNIHIHFKSFSV